MRHPPIPNPESLIAGFEKRRTSLTRPNGVDTSYDNPSRMLGGLAQGERSPAVLCQSTQVIPDQDGRIVQIIGSPAGVDGDMNRRAALALRQPAGFMGD